MSYFQITKGGPGELEGAFIGIPLPPSSKISMLSYNVYFFTLGAPVSLRLVVIVRFSLPSIHPSHSWPLSITGRYALH